MASAKSLFIGMATVTLRPSDGRLSLAWFIVIINGQGFWLYPIIPVVIKARSFHQIGPCVIFVIVKIVEMRLSDFIHRDEDWARIHFRSRLSKLSVFVFDPSLVQDDCSFFLFEKCSYEAYELDVIDDDFWPKAHKLPVAHERVCGTDKYSVESSLKTVIDTVVTYR